MKKLLLISAFILVTFFVIGYKPLAFQAIRQTEGIGIDPIGLPDNMKVSQTFIAVSDNVRGVGLMIGTYDTISDGSVLVELFEFKKVTTEIINGKKIAESRAFMKNITDDGLHVFWFPKGTKVKKGKKYVINVTTKLKSGRGIALWKTKKDTDAYIDGGAYAQITDDSYRQASNNNLSPDGDLSFFVYESASINNIDEVLSKNSIVAPLIILAAFVLMIASGSIALISYPEDDSN